MNNISGYNLDSLLSATPDEESFESLALSRRVLRQLRKDLPQYRIRMVFMAIFRLLLIAAAWVLVLFKVGPVSPYFYYICGGFLLYAAVEAVTIHYHLKEIRDTLDSDSIKVEHLYTSLREAMFSPTRAKGKETLRQTH